MCNLYSLTKGQDAIRRLFNLRQDRVGNLPPLPGIYPDQPAPVIRMGEGPESERGRELAMMRWGMPCPPAFGGRPVTNIRNTRSPHWRRWLNPASRCLVPATSFCEWTDSRPKAKRWFAPDSGNSGEDEPLFAFAGIWTPWTGVRGTKANPVEGEHLVFGFLTCEPNAVVAKVHAKAMPVILTTEAEWAAWLTAPAAEALALQRPLPDAALRIVAAPAAPA